MFRKTQDPQKVDSPIANAEWKADPGLRDIVHGVEAKVSAPFISFISYTVGSTFKESVELMERTE